MLLRNFLYLDTTALAGYLSALEDGLRTEVEREATKSRDRSVTADAKVLGGKLGAGATETGKVRNLDTPEAQFSRLLQLAEGGPEGLAWIEVMNPDTDLVDVGRGAMVAGEADFYVPTIVRTLANRGEMGAALDMIDQLEPMADVFGLDMEGMPDRSERDAMRAAISSINAKLAIVGEFDQSVWKVAAQLSGEHMRAEIEGPVRFVGKVSASWPATEGRHLMALPGMTLLPRKKRRELERKKPENPDDDSFLWGPALMLDLLAVWR